MLRNHHGGLNSSDVAAQDFNGRVASGLGTMQGQTYYDSITARRFKDARQLAAAAQGHAFPWLTMITDWH